MSKLISFYVGAITLILIMTLGFKLIEISEDGSAAQKTYNACRAQGATPFGCVTGLR